LRTVLESTTAQAGQRVDSGLRKAVDQDRKRGAAACAAGCNTEGALRYAAQEIKSAIMVLDGEKLQVRSGLSQVVIRAS
jgi:hypothetical protein